MGLIIVEKYADNGEVSHHEVVEGATGEIIIKDIAGVEAQLADSVPFAVIGKVCGEKHSRAKPHPNICSHSNNKWGNCTKQKCPLANK